MKYHGQQMLVTLNREALEASLIEMPVSHGPVRHAPAHVCASRRIKSVN
jgi:hypothetical protein